MNRGVAILIAAILFFGLCASAQTKKAKKKMSADPCPGSQTQLELNQCFDNNARASDSRLNRVFRRSLALMKEDADRAAKRNNAEEKKTAADEVEALKSAQRAWIHYRDLHCAAAEQQYKGGSMAPMIYSGCLADLTEQRITALKNAYEVGDRHLE